MYHYVSVCLHLNKQEKHTCTETTKLHSINYVRLSLVICVGGDKYTIFLIWVIKGQAIYSQKESTLIYI